MTRRKNIENEGLPERWRFKHGAYYYRVPAGLREFWDFKQDYRLGETFDTAMEVYIAGLARVNKSTDPRHRVDDVALILGRSSPYPCLFIYFLFEGDLCVYIGKSWDPAGRMKHHTRAGRVFTRFTIEPCSIEEADRLEALYISANRPKYNMEFAREI